MSRAWSAVFVQSRLFFVFGIVFAIAGTQAPSLAQSFDLSSKAHTQPSSALPATGVSMVIDGRAMRVAPGAMLTPAELVAAQQVLATGRQGLVLGAGGNAIGGTFVLNSAAASNFVIPSGVTAIQNAATVGTLAVNGLFSNSGRFFALSNSAATTAATIDAGSIVNQRGALLSSVLPPGGLPGFSKAISRVDLNLIARDSLTNYGTIASSGVLNIASSSIHNEGLVQAIGGDINVRGFATQNISIVGSGTFAAPNGAINLIGGTGDVYAHFGDVVGAVNTFGNFARVGASTKDLTLGAIKLDGDPTFYNDAGNVNITGNIQVGESLSIIASGDITTSAGVTLLQAQEVGGQGYPITLIAGADVTGTNPTLTADGTLAGAATGPVSVNGASATGGKINFSASTALTIKTDSTCTDCAAANVVMAAYAGTSPGSGSIDVSKASISAVGNGDGANGDVLGFAGATTGNGILIGGINAGNVSLYTTQPETSDNSPMVFETDGSVSSGNVFSPGAFFNPTKVQIGATTSSGRVVIQTLGDVKLNGALTALGADVQSGGILDFVDNVDIKEDLSAVGTNILSHANKLIKAPIISFSSPDRAPLTVSLNGATLNSTYGTNIATGGNVTFTTSGRFAGPAHIASDSAIIVTGGATLSSAEVIEVTTPQLTQSGLIVATGLQWNNPSSSGAGTIVNPGGDVVLSSNLTYKGQSLAILAAGNIVAKPNVTSINLSSATGNGGSLTLIAGYEFSQLKPDDPPIEDSPKPTGGGFIIERPSGGGGSILMPTVNIDTSSTSKDPLHNSAGEVLIVGRIGATMGLISVNNISAKSTNGTGGYIHLIGEGGIQAGTITNASARGNMIRLNASEPRIIGGDFIVTNGILSGSGMFGIEPTSRNLGSAVHVRGTITTTSSVLNAGSVEIRADRDIIVNGAVTAKGHTQNSVFGSLTGGSVVMLSNVGSITTGGINTSGLTVDNVYHNHDPNHFTAAGSAGNIALLSLRDITVNGSLIANGAPIKNKFDISGYGGRILVQTGNAATSVGQVKITGYVTTRPGAAAAGFSGDGGDVLMQGNTVRVMGTSGGVSINTAYMPALDHQPNAGGTIEIHSSTNQLLPDIFDLQSTKANVPVHPGGAFSIGIANPVNGVAGSLLTDLALGPVNKSDFQFSGGYITQALNYSAKGATVSVLGPAITAPPVLNGIRQYQTPLSAVQAWQTQHSQTPLHPINGGTVTVTEFDVPQKFTAFNVPVGFVFEVTGISPVLTLPVTPVIAGEILYTPSVPRGGKMLVDFGAGSGNILAGGSIQATGNSTLLLSTNAATFKNAGIISGKEIVFARTSTGPLTVQNNGAAAGINATRAIVISTDTSPTLAYNFRANGSTFSSPVIVDDVQYSPQYDALSLAWAKNFTKTPTVNVTFALSDANAQAIPAVFGGKADAASVSIATVPLTFNKTKVLTPLEIQFSGEFNSNGTLKVSSLGKLQLDDGATLRSSKDMKITAPAVDIQGSVFLSAGELSDADDGTGVVATSNIKSAGGITLTATGPDGINLVGSNSYFRTVGKNLAFTASGGSMTLNEANIFAANGGRLLVTAKGTITDSGINTYTARSTDVKTNTGGGIYFGSGVTTATAGTTALNQAFTKPAGTVGGVNTTGITFDTTHGVFWQKGTGTVTLSDPPGLTTITMNGGAVVFESNGPGGNINLKGANITTNALKPVDAITQVTEGHDEFVIDTDI